MALPTKSKCCDNCKDGKLNAMNFYACTLCPCHNLQKECEHEGCGRVCWQQDPNKLTEKGQEERKGYCLRCGLETQPTMKCKCPFRQQSKALWEGLSAHGVAMRIIETRDPSFLGDYLDHITVNVKEAAFLDGMQVKFGAAMDYAREESRRKAIEEWGFKELKDAVRYMLDTHYPPDVFDGSSGDIGPRFIAKLHEAMTIVEPKDA